MLAYAIRRVLLIIPLIVAVATVTFFLMHTVQGGPFDGDKPLTPATRAALERRYGLDKPLVEQYGMYLKNLATGDLGISFSNDRPVRDIIRDRFPVSLQLGICTFIFALVGGLTLGIISSLNQNGLGDYVGVFIATSGAALPSFVLAPLLVIAFALHLHWFDTIGWEMWNYKKMVLPTVAFGFLPMSFVARITRASMLDVLRQDYIRTARAKGVREFVVVMRHAVKNAMIPVLTVLGPIFATLVVGSFIIERAFQIPGLGRAFVDSVLIRDYGVIMGVTVFYALVIAVMNLVVDLLYGVADPRIRY
ncbi:MAG: ABC transporter permease [Dehalococcoidia bacterium]|nr:ABC transporter permease [Dehalococcoidia bacterium]